MTKNKLSNTFSVLQFILLLRDTVRKSSPKNDLMDKNGWWVLT